MFVESQVNQGVMGGGGSQEPEGRSEQSGVTSCWASLQLLAYRGSPFGDSQTVWELCLLAGSERAYDLLGGSIVSWQDKAPASLLPGGLRQESQHYLRTVLGRVFSG